MGGEGTLCTSPGSETQKRPRRNRVEIEFRKGRKIFNGCNMGLTSLCVLIVPKALPGLALLLTTQLAMSLSICP